MKLALLGGQPIRTELYPAYNTIGDEEKKAVQEVLDTGNLSQFLGAWHADFFGGPRVRAFEENWAKKFQSKYALSVNSNTSGLIAAMAAIGVGPGDEVIVSPYTMSASAIAPLMLGAVPIFADIDPHTFGLSVESITQRITPRTKAVLVVHIFGHPVDMDAILAITRPKKIRIVEDCAQAPGATYKTKNVGTLGDIGVFSLNYHKHIHSGEGGVLTTQDEELFKRLQLIRNHGEAVVADYPVQDLYQTQGYNFRMTEIEAAIANAQLMKLDGLIEKRIALAENLSKRLKGFKGITTPVTLKDNRHVYYLHTLKIDRAVLGIHRNTLAAALRAELPSSHLRETTHLIGGGYVKPLYLQPIYQKRISRCSFECPRYEGKPNYALGSCPTTERMHFEEVLTHEFIRPVPNAEIMIDDFVRAFEKVESQLKELAAWESQKTTSGT